MIPGAFAYHRPKSVNEAVALLADLGEDARPLGGGHSLIPLMKLRLAAPAHLVDLQGIKDLKGISAEGDAVVIGATVTQNEVIGSELLATKVPILRETALQIADPQVRYLRHDRRQRRQWRSRQRHAGGHDRARRYLPAHRKGRDAERAGARLLPGRLRDRAAAGRDPDGDPHPGLWASTATPMKS